MNSEEAIEDKSVATDTAEDPVFIGGKNVIIDRPCLLVDDNGVGWWVNPHAPSIVKAFPR
jgi:hypothetical protein